MMPKNSEPIRTSHFLNQNHSSTRKNIKIKLTGSRCLAGVHHRQAVHHKTQKLGCRFVVPAVQGFNARRFLRETRNILNVHVPPGGYEQPARRFLEKIPEIQISMHF